MNSHISSLNRRESNSKSLKLSSTKLGNTSVENLLEVEVFNEEIHVVKLLLSVQHFRNGSLSLDGSRDMVDVLRLDECLEIVLKNFGEVVLEFGSSEVLEDIGPIRRILIEEGPNAGSASLARPLTLSSWNSHRIDQDLA